MGVSDILTPEEEVAKSVSQRLLNSGIVDLLYLAGDHHIVEIHTPERFTGKTLQDLKIRERFHCNIIAIIKPNTRPRQEIAYRQVCGSPLPTSNSAMKTPSSFSDWPKISSR